jgi:hypothetical protein
LPIATEKQRLAAAIQRDEARRIAIEYRQAAGEGMSAIPPKADIAERDRMSALCQKRKSNPLRCFNIDGDSNLPE